MKFTIALADLETLLRGAGVSRPKKTDTLLEKQFYGRLNRLLVIKDGEDFVFKIDGRIFGSMTAAARYVYQDETRTISGPQFWGAPLAK